MTFGSDWFVFFYTGCFTLGLLSLKTRLGLFGCVKDDDDDTAHQALNLLVSLQDVLLLNLSRVIICSSTVSAFNFLAF